MKSCIIIHLSSTTSIKIPSLSSPPSLLTSSSSPPPLLLPHLETMTLRARVRSLEHHDVVTRESLRIERGRITRSQLRVEYAKQEVRKLREFQVTDRFKMAELQSRAQDIKASFWDLERHLGPQTYVLASFIASFGLYPTKLE
ncbi:hypothetical protein Tco_0263546 [Tanacetum coccineum]